MSGHVLLWLYSDILRICFVARLKRAFASRYVVGIVVGWFILVLCPTLPQYEFARIVIIIVNAKIYSLLNIKSINISRILHQWSALVCITDMTD